MIVFVGGRAFAVFRLNGAQWAYSIILGALSIPIAVIIRLIPDELIRKFIPSRLHRKQTPQLLVSDEDQRYEWDPFEEIREELTFLKTLRGGRLNVLKYRLQHPRQTLLPRSRSASRTRSDSVCPLTPSGDRQGAESGSPAPPSPGSRSQRRGRSRSNSAFAPAAAMAGVIAGSIAGWSPIDRGHGEDESVKGARARDRSDLEMQEGISVHPDTEDKDPIIVKDPHSLGAPPSQVKETTPSFDKP